MNWDLLLSIAVGLVSGALGAYILLSVLTLQRRKNRPSQATQCALCGEAIAKGEASARRRITVPVGPFMANQQAVVRRVHDECNRLIEQGDGKKRAQVEVTA